MAEETQAMHWTNRLSRVAPGLATLWPYDRKKGPSLKHVVVDMLPVTMIDATGLYTTQEVAEELERRGVSLSGAGRETEWRKWAESRGFTSGYVKAKMYPTIKAAIKACAGKEAVTDEVVGEHDDPQV
jgi:hypothetical protein